MDKKFSIFIVFMVMVFCSLSATQVHADDSAVPPPYVKCSEVRPNGPNPYIQGVPIFGKNTEFQSLRPYQASPCITQATNYASYCGNDLTVKDTITVEYPGSENYLTGTGCVQSGDKINCTYSVPVSKTITINLTGANLPIMGNTEDVINYKNTKDTLSDADKMNDYVSWYLGGVTSKKEYPDKLSNDSLVNYSGPLAKLLPQQIQQAQRIKTVNDEEQKTVRHNQVVVCTKTELADLKGMRVPWLIKEVVRIGLAKVGINISIDGWETFEDFVNKYSLPNSIWDVLKGILEAVGIGPRVPAECDQSILNILPGGTKARRIDYWSPNRDLSFFNTLINAIGYSQDKIAQLFHDIFPQFPIQAIEDALKLQENTHPWNKMIPPLQGDINPVTGKVFTDLEYNKAYNEWKGKYCIAIPLFNNLLCIDTFLTSDEPANMFSYIPLSSTEDVTGQLTVDGVSTATNPNINGTTLSEVTFTNQKGTGDASSTLYFAHMEESSEEASLLQSTFVPKGQDQVGSPTNIAAETSCKSVEVRSNAGDNLFASSIVGKLGYTANFTCQYDYLYCSTDVIKDCTSTPGYSCQEDSTGGHCIEGTPTTTVQTCNKDVFVALSTTSSTPLVDDIWSRLVAGPMAIFKRMFPKTNTEGSVGQIIDIAGSTNITYSGDNIPTSNTDLKLPHIGGISEYFLKGIQTALRPKGYGDTIEFAGNSVDLCKTSTMPTLPVGQNFCTLKSTILPGASSDKMPQTLVDIIQAASQTYNTPPGLIVGIMYGEGIFNSGRLNWTDANVKSWATCGKVPGCSETGNDDHFMGFSGTWDSIVPHIKGDLLRLDPTRTSPSQCNLLDAIYGEAWTLHDNADGSPYFKNSSTGKGYTCLGQTLNVASDIPYSCAWDPSQYESAIRVNEFGTGWGQTSYGFLTCATKDNSCASGGSTAAECPTDTATSFDTCAISGNNSHNLCIWDVAHSH